jgi:hypothetical protein
MAHPSHDGVVVSTSVQPVTLEIDGETVAITNFRASLPTPAPAKDRVGFVRAGVRQGLALDNDALHAAARVFVDPATVQRLVDNSLLGDETVGSTRLVTARQLAYLTELLPLIQPRAGAAARTVEPPRITGSLRGDGVNQMPEAMTVIRLHDEEHLIAQVTQTVRETLVMGRDYSASILTKRVSRPGLAHVARLEFDNGEMFYISILRDGITRAVSSWQVMYPDLTVDQLADLIVTTLLASKRGRRADETETAQRARGRDEKQQLLRAQFVAGMATGEPTEKAIRISQALTMPVQMILSVEAEGAAVVPVADQFDDAVQGLVASVHGEFQPWEQSASDAAAILRALPRVVNDGSLDERVAQMAAGYLPVSEMPTVFGKTAPATELWRAVYLISRLSSPVEFEGIKKHLRELLGMSRIERKTYVNHLMTLIDLPWRSAKADTRLQARRAWANGGPIPHSLLGTSWDPVPASDFTALVASALGGDENARATLQVAGGIALVTDKLLMSNTGSALTSGDVPFRANVNEVVTNLGNTEMGLWLLARAANAFSPTRRAVNSFTPKELMHLAPTDTYVVPRIDPEQPQRLHTDNAGQYERLTTYEVVYLSDPERARNAESTRKDVEDRQRKTNAETNSQKAERYRTELKKYLDTALNSLKSLMDLGGVDGSLQPILVNTETWQGLDNTARALSGELYNQKPPERPILANAAELADVTDQFGVGGLEDEESIDTEGGMVS